MGIKKLSLLFITVGFLAVAVRANAQAPFKAPQGRLLAQVTLPDPSIIPSGIPVPGFNCGNAYDTNGANKCCFQPVIKPKLIDWTTFPFSEVAKWVNGALEDKLGPIIGMQRQIHVEPCQNGEPSVPGEPENPACVCVVPTSSPLAAIVPLCDRINPKSIAQGGSERDACVACMTGAGGQASGVWTSVGCVKGNLSTFIQESVLGWGIGLAGGLSLMCIMYAAFMMQTSRGNAEVIKKAQQLMTSCITGLMLTIFSVFILRIIGVTILKIPGFTP